jgi:hypothetical protein
MPRSDGGPDRSGIRYEGDVLTGKISVEEAHAKAAREVAQAQVADKHRRGDHSNCYTTPENYDPVLRQHLGIGKPY